MVGGQFAVEAAFVAQPVQQVVAEAVALAVLVGQAGQPPGRVVVVVEVVPQRVGTPARQAVGGVLVVGVPSFAVAVPDQPVGCVVLVVFFAAVGVDGQNQVLPFVVVVFGALAQFVGDGGQLSVGGVVQSGAAAGAVGNLFRLIGGVVAVFGAVLLRVGYRQQQAFVIVMVTAGAFERVSVAQQVARFVVAVAVVAAFAVAAADEAVVVVVVVVQDDAVGAGDAFHLPFVAVLITGYPPQRVGVAQQPAEVVAFHDAAAAVGIHPFGQFVVVVVMILLAAPQDVGHFGIAVVIAEMPFFAQAGPVAQYFAAGVVVVVFVVGHQSGGVAVFGQNVVAVAEMPSDAAVAAEDADQVARFVVLVAHQFAPAPARRAERRQRRQQADRAQPRQRPLPPADIGKVQFEHPSVAVDDVLRQAALRMVDKALVIAVAVFHRHQRVMRAAFAMRVGGRNRRSGKTQRQRTVQRTDVVIAVVVFAEPDLFAFEQHRFVVLLVHFGQREQPSLFVDVGQAVAAADEALAAGHAPACPQPAGAVLVGVVAAVPYQRQDAFEGEVGFVLQKLQPVYRVDRPAGRRRRFAGDARFGRQPLLELAVHVEQVAGTDDVAFANFDAGGMAHRPGRFGGGSA